MTDGLIGLGQQEACRILEGQGFAVRVYPALPRRRDGRVEGMMRVVRIKITDGQAEIWVSPFMPPAGQN
nr:hypothetical protein [bacterium]